MEAARASTASGTESESAGKGASSITFLITGMVASTSSARMLLQVHDELVFEVREDEVEATMPVITKVMEDAPFPALSLSVPLAVDARAASNWDEAH